MNRSDGGPDFPLTIVWPAGERETWEDEEDLAMKPDLLTYPCGGMCG
jgi:hypothetical protein